MSMLNTERLREIPGAAEELVQEYCHKVPASAESILEIAKSTGSGQFVKDAEAFIGICEKLSTMVKNVVGDEADTLTDNGTVMAAYNAGVKAEKALGGEL